MPDGDLIDADNKLTSVSEICTVHIGTRRFKSLEKDSLSDTEDSIAIYVQKQLCSTKCDVIAKTHQMRADLKRYFRRRSDRHVRTFAALTCSKAVVKTQAEHCFSVS